MLPKRERKERRRLRTSVWFLKDWCLSVLSSFECFYSSFLSLKYAACLTVARRRRLLTARLPRRWTWYQYQHSAITALEAYLERSQRKRRPFGCGGQMPSVPQTSEWGRRGTASRFGWHTVAKVKYHPLFDKQTRRDGPENEKTGAF